MSDWGQLAVNVSQTVANRASNFVQKGLLFTASDVRQAAIRSIKSGGKKRTSKNWQTSRPGEPPRSHGGAVKNAIRYLRKDPLTYVIGPEQIGTSTTLKTLEYGGQGAVKTTFYDETYSARRKKSARRRKSGAPEPIRPRAKRPYKVVTRSNPRGVTVRDYLYFKSEDAYRRAQDSSEFQAWASRQRTTDVLRVDVSARPFMRPALAAQTTAAKIQARMTRASRK